MKVGSLHNITISSVKIKIWMMFPSGRQMIKSCLALVYVDVARLPRTDLIICVSNDDRPYTVVLRHLTVGEPHLNKHRTPW